MHTPVSSELYDSNYYTKYNHGFDSYNKGGLLMPDLEKIFKDVDFKDKVILDVGCGRGEFVCYALSKGAAYAVGIDYSKASVDISNELITNMFKDSDTINQVKILQMDAKHLEFTDDAFDIIVLLDIVEHLHDWELKQCLHEVVRVLKDDGYVYMHTSPNKYMMVPVRHLAGLFGVHLTSDKFHVNEQSYKSVKRYFNGFKGNLLLIKDKRYWSNQMGSRGKLLKLFAGVVDSILDFKVLSYILCKFPFNLFFSTDLWYIGTKKKYYVKTDYK
jgi:ubiquinone/menaquinone biosynthesis C-methylase UbiE